MSAPTLAETGQHPLEAPGHHRIAGAYEAPAAGPAGTSSGCRTTLPSTPGGVAAGPLEVIRSGTAGD